MCTGKPRQLRVTLQQSAIAETLMHSSASDLCRNPATCHMHSLPQECCASAPVVACMHLALLLPPHVLHVMSFHCRYVSTPLPAANGALTRARTTDLGSGRKGCTYLDQIQVMLGQAYAQPTPCSLMSLTITWAG